MNLLLFLLLSSLWSCGANNKRDKKAVSIPIPLAVISNRNNQKGFKDYGVKFTEINQLNRLALPLSLGGFECRSPHKNFSKYKIVNVIPKNSPLEIIQSFPKEGGLSSLLQKVGAIERPIGSYFKLGRTGPIPFDIVQDQKGIQTAIHKLTTTYPKDTLRKEALKANKILEDFKNKKTDRAKVTLVFENPKEKHKKCGFYGPGPAEGIPREFFNTVKKMFEETKGFHTFSAIQEHEQNISMTLDKKSLAYLIFKSQDLNIKDILLQ